nr:DUF5372 family protein [Rhizobium leguminosarum]
MSTRKQNWGEDRVMFYDAQGRLRSLPASWTDVNEADLQPRSPAPDGRSEPQARGRPRPLVPGSRFL